MHHLVRGQPPSCLNNYEYGRHTWDDVPFADKEAIRAALQTMQGVRCAYCECDLLQHDQHIEHFEQKGRRPAGTFAWENLFWSCSREDSCGKHKDKCGAYNKPDLIKPDVDDPEHFFLFTYDGSIALRPGLTPSEERRAKETLRIFNLDEQWGPLRRFRQLAVLGYLQTMKELEELAAVLSEQDINDYVAKEFAYTRNLPFCTAIKHALTPVH